MPEKDGNIKTIKDLELYEVSLVAEEPNPAYGVYPIEVLKKEDV